MPTLIPNPSFIIHKSCYVYTILHYIHVPHHSNHTQTKTNHPGINKHPNTILSRPTPRSGWRVSLRRDILVQASPLRLGEGSKRTSRSNAGSRLGETPLAWARCSLAQNKKRVAWATSRVNWSGRVPVCLT